VRWYWHEVRARLTRQQNGPRHSKAGAVRISPCNPGPIPQETRVRVTNVTPKTDLSVVTGVARRVTLGGMTQQQTSPQISATDPLNELAKQQQAGRPAAPDSSNYDVQITVKIRDWTQAGSVAEAVAMAEDKIGKVFPQAGVEVVAGSAAKYGA
jgi:hypothetical protein